MLKLYKPEIKDLSFRQEMLSDEKTMSYNHAYGGVIIFGKDKWNIWANKWLNEDDNKHYYRYLINDKGNYVGEISYHLDDGRYMCDVLIHSKYRHQGYGKEALNLLLRQAYKNGLKEIYDDIAIDNSAINLFLNNGFIEVNRNNECITVKSELNNYLCI